MSHSLQPAAKVETNISKLVVVVASLARNRSSLAVGNVIGSAISNILGAFSIGLLTHKQEIEFDYSSKVYSCLLLVATTLVAPLACFPKRDIWLAFGCVLLGLFAVYVASVAWAIHRGSITAPEGSDSDRDDDGGSDDEDNSGEATLDASRTRAQPSSPNANPSNETETSPLLLTSATPSQQH